MLKKNSYELSTAEKSQLGFKATARYNQTIVSGIILGVIRQVFIIGFYHASKRKGLI